MDLDINTWRSLATVASFAAFIGVVVWAWRQRASGALDEAAKLPFMED